MGTALKDTPRAGGHSPVSAYPVWSAGEGQGIQRFIEELDEMTPAQRLAAYRESFGRRERSIWAVRYPEEVPLVNDEFEWIALPLP